MAVKMVRTYTCDGAKCGKVLASADDGLVFAGPVSAPDAADGARPVIGHRPGDRTMAAEETALCWDCFHGAVRDPVLDRALAAADSARASSREYDQGDYRPGARPSGPLPPPELPHCAAVARALAGVG